MNNERLFICQHKFTIARKTSVPACLQRMRKNMKSYELQSVDFLPNGAEVVVVYREKTFFAGSSAIIVETMTIKRFVELFGRRLLPLKAKK